MRSLGGKGISGYSTASFLELQILLLLLLFLGCFPVGQRQEAVSVTQHTKQRKLTCCVEVGEFALLGAIVSFLLLASLHLA